MTELLIEAVKGFVELFGKAMAGDDDAMARVGDTLPHLRTKLTRARHDARDLAKFGPKPTEDR